MDHTTYESDINEDQTMIREQDSDPIDRSDTTSASEDGESAEVHQLEYIKIFQMTWNMQGTVPTSPSMIESIKEILSPSKYHIYCFTAQECERSIEKSVVNQKKEKWELILQQLLGDDYVMLQSSTLVGLHISLFIQNQILGYVSTVRKGVVPCGVEILSKDLGNKGAVFIGFQIRNRKFLFIGCHLPASQEKVELRNQSYERIVESMNERVRDGSFDSIHIPFIEDDFRMLSGANGSHTEHYFGVRFPHTESFHNDDETIFSFFDYIVWSGDLNYRINGNRNAIDKLLSLKMVDVLKANDQLTIERKKGRVFEGFVEGSITFPPTYKFSPISDEYDQSKKKRIPAWTDRILFYSRKSRNRSIQIDNYWAAMDLRLSDHRPVVATATVQWGRKDNSPPSLASRTEKASSICNVQ